jgi:hypothetical protein
MKQATWDGDREHQDSLSWSAITQKAGIGEIWPGWTAISKRPGRRTKRLHIISIGPEHRHPSSDGPSTWPRLSGASRGLRPIFGDITESWINRNSERNTTGALGSPEKAWNIARNKWMRSKSSWITGRRSWRSTRTRSEGLGSGRLLGRPADSGSWPACSHSEGQSQDFEGEVRFGVDERPGYYKSALRRSEPEVQGGGLRWA